MRHSGDERFWPELKTGVGHHAWFWDMSSGPDLDNWPHLKHRVAVADDSGPTPELTDDGLLYLDRSRMIVIACPFCLIPLVRPSGEKTATVAGAHEAREVALRFGLEATYA